MENLPLPSRFESGERPNPLKTLWSAVLARHRIHVKSCIFLNLPCIQNISVMRSYFMNLSCYSVIRLCVWLGPRGLPQSQNQLEDTKSWQSIVGTRFVTLSPCRIA